MTTFRLNGATSSATAKTYMGVGRAAASGASSAPAAVWQSGHECATIGGALMGKVGAVALRADDDAGTEQRREFASGRMGVAVGSHRRSRRGQALRKQREGDEDETEAREQGAKPRPPEFAATGAYAAQARLHSRRRERQAKRPASQCVRLAADMRGPYAAGAAPMSNANSRVRAAKAARSTAEPALAARQRRERVAAIALMALAVVFFAGLDSSAKYLSRTLPAVEVVWARYLGAAMVAAAATRVFARPRVLRSRRPGLQALRSVLLLGSTVANFFALRKLQLAETSTIAFLSPIFIALLSGPLLGEWPGRARLAAIAVGFVGVVAATRRAPGRSSRWCSSPSQGRCATPAIRWRRAASPGATTAARRCCGRNSRAWWR